MGLLDNRFGVGVCVVLFAHCCSVVVAGNFDCLEYVYCSWVTAGGFGGFGCLLWLGGFG